MGGAATRSGFAAALLMVAAVGCFDSTDGEAGETQAGDEATAGTTGSGGTVGGEAGAQVRPAGTTPTDGDPMDADAAPDAGPDPTGDGSEGPIDAGVTQPTAETCLQPGFTQTGCLCETGRFGSRRCLENRVWSACVCEEPLPPSGCDEGQVVVCQPLDECLEPWTTTCDASGNFDCRCGARGFAEPCTSDPACAVGTCLEGQCTAACTDAMQCTGLDGAAVCSGGLCALPCGDASQCPRDTTCVMVAAQPATCRPP